MRAAEYIYIQCGMSAAALLPEGIHLKGTRVQLDSPLNEQGENVFSEDSIEALKEMYYNEKWGSPLQLFMPDGTVIGRVWGLEGNAALRKYFEENVLGTGEYVNYLDSETLDPYYKDRMMDPTSRESYENGLYFQWLSATYGKTGMDKAGVNMVTTGANPMVAVLKEELKNHPEKALQRGMTGAALSVLSTPLSSLILTGLQNKTAIRGMVQSQYFSNIESAVCTQRNWNQMRDTNGNE